MGSGSTLVTSFYLHPLLKRPQFQIQPHSEVLGVWTSPYEFRGNTVQSMTGDQGIAHIFPSAKLPVCVGNLGLYRHTEVSTFYFCLHQRMQPFPLKIITGAQKNYLTDAQGNQKHACMFYSLHFQEYVLDPLSVPVKGGKERKVRGETSLTLLAQGYLSSRRQCPLKA